MEWMYYLLEANLYLLLFYGFYKLFLQHDTFYNSNRYFLLLSTLTAFVLPVLQLGFLKPAPIVDHALFPPPVLYTVDELASITSNPVAEPTSYTVYLYPIYLLVAFVFAIKLIFSLVKIVRLWAKADKKSTGKITIIELDAQKTAFSFFNLLFIHPHLAEKETVFKHELVHIKQKHSLDILFFEILQIICWFNPIVYFIKKDIKLLHEYIADDLSTKQGMQKHEYAMFLIENSFGVMPTPLTNQIFNQSILKRRINMLNKKRTANWARLRLLLALPLTGGMLCISTMAFTKNYGYVDLLPEKSDATVAVLQEVPQQEQAQVKFPPPIIREDKTSFYPMRSVDKKGNVNSIDLRTIVINGKKVEDLETFFGVTNASNVVDVDAASAVKKYGKAAKYGAVEITGNNLKYVKSLADGPPPPIMEQVKFPPPIVKPNQKKLKDPPAIEAPPVGYGGKNGEINKTPNLNASIPKVDKVVKGYPLRKNKEDLKEVTVVGYGTQSNPTKVVNGYPLRKNKEDLKEVTVVGYGTQSNPTKVVQGYPVNSNKDELKEVKVIGYGLQSNPDKVVQGYPINGKGDQLKEIKIQAKPQKSTKREVQGYPINENKTKEVKVEGYPTKQNNSKSNEPVDGDEVSKYAYQTKLSGLPSAQSLAQKTTAYTLRGKANTHRYVTASKTVYLSDSLRLKKNK